MIIFEVEDEETGQNVVCGGYTSCGWTSDLFGDISCFVFNLTHNIKLKALEKVASRFTFITTETGGDHTDTQNTSQPQ